MILTKINLPIAVCSLLLLSTGILVISTSSLDLAIQQSTFAIIGIAAFLFMSLSDYRSIKSLITPLYIVVFLLLILVSFLGFETRGSVRWIPFGFFNIQPSEFAKPVLILTLASFWAKNYPSWKNIALSLIWTMPLALLIFRQPDLGSALTILAIWLGMLFASHVSFRKIMILTLITILIIPIGWLSLHEYQKQRVYSFLAPHSDPLGTGYNLIQSTIAVGSGQVVGRGLGRGTQSRLQFLPEFRTDFIFASIAEELGFIGSVIILFLYLFMITYVLKLSEKAFDLFGFLIVFGVMSMLFFQTSVNIGMNVGLIPITGITLPLISYGGSSLVATLISLGMVASVGRFKKRIDLD